MTEKFAWVDTITTDKLRSELRKVRDNIKKTETLLIYFNNKKKAIESVLNSRNFMVTKFKQKLENPKNR